MRSTAQAARAHQHHSHRHAREHVCEISRSLRASTDDVRARERDDRQPDHRDPMSASVQVLLEYDYLVLYAFVLAEQVGLPIPAVPVLLTVGTLAGSGRMSLALALAVALFASLVPDILWYELGRRRGGRVLGLLCRISLEPDSCVRRTQRVFLKGGRFALLIAKFFPGLST